MKRSELLELVAIKMETLHVHACTVTQCLEIIRVTGSADDARQAYQESLRQQKLVHEMQQSIIETLVNSLPEF